MTLLIDFTFKNNSLSKSVLESKFHTIFRIVDMEAVSSSKSSCSISLKYESPVKFSISQRAPVDGEIRKEAERNSISLMTCEPSDLSI